MESLAKSEDNCVYYLDNEDLYDNLKGDNVS